MTTTQTTTDTRFDRMIEEFKVARFRFNNSRLGSSKGDAAERKMERLVEQAEKMGRLDEFVRIVCSTSS